MQRVHDLSRLFVPCLIGISLFLALHLRLSGQTTLTTGTYTNETFSGPVAVVASNTITLAGTNSFASAIVTFGLNADMVIAASGTFTSDSASTVSGDISIISAAAGASFLNQGTITHSANNSHGAIYATTFTNEGSISALNTAGYILTLGQNTQSFTNALGGTITANGTNTYVDLQGVNNLGTLVATNNGHLRFLGTFTTAELGTVQLSAGGRALLQSGGTLDNTSATLNAVTGGQFELAGGTINNGNISALGLTSSGGTINNATFDGTLSLAASSFANLGGTVVFDDVTATFGLNSDLNINASAAVTFNAGSTGTGDLSINTTAAGASFTNQGTLTHSANNSHGSIYATTFTNEGSITALNTAGYILTLGQNAQSFTNALGGTITANGTNTYVDLQGVNNLGTLVATNNGQLRFLGTFTTAELGTVQLSAGGRALIQSGGTLDNTAATLNAVTGGQFELAGGTINNGNISALGFTSSGGTVNNATFDGTVTLAASSFANLGGTVLFDDVTATFGLNSDFVLNTGSAVTFNAGSTGTGDLSITSSNAGASFTNQGTLTHSANNSHGAIYAPTFSNAGSITALNTAGYILTLGQNAQSFTNALGGTITANGTNTYVDLQGVNNLGTLVATNNGHLRFLGTFTTAELGTVQLSAGGRALIQSGGTLDNTSATLNAVTGGQFELAGGIINNGNISALGFTSSGGTVNNATFDGTVTLAASSFANLGGTVLFDDVTATFGLNSDFVLNTGSAVTFNAGSTGTGDLSITSSNAGASFTNQGTLTHSANNSHGAIYAPTFSNAGSITALNTAGYILTLGQNTQSFTNALGGTITANGTNTYVDLQGVNNLGTLVATNNGQLRFLGTFTTAELGTVQLSAGGRALIQSGGTLDNTAATLNAVTGGQFELAGGIINNGNISALGFTSSGGTVNNATFDGTVSLAASSFANLGGTILFDDVTATFGLNSDFVLNTGSTVTFNAGSTGTGDLSITSSNAGASFTNQGTLTHSANNSHGAIYAPTFSNAGSITALNTAGYILTLGQNAQSFTNALGGTITANGTNTYVDLQGVNNLGTLVATNNGQLRFLGTFTTAELGTVQLSAGGRALIQSGGTLDNTAATLNAVTGGQFELAGGIINNGNISALGFTSSGGTVNNATFDGTVTLAASSFANLGGTVLFDDVTATFGLNSDFVLNTGSAVTFNAGSTGTGDLSITSSNAGASFTNQGTLTHSANNSHGAIYAPTFSNQGSITALNTAGYILTLGQNAQSFTNALGGTITANGTNTYVDLQGVNNLGTLVATNNGQLRFLGTFTTAELGTVQLSAGGRALIQSGGTLDNTSATLNAVTGGQFELAGGTINNGNISALGFTSSGGTVNNATFDGTVTLAASSFANLGGTVLFDDVTATFGINSSLNLNASANVTFNAGSIGTGDLSITSSNAGASFTNQGTLTHSANNSHGSLYAPTFTNEGSITAQNTAGYTLTLGSTGQTFTNASSGLVHVDNAIITLAAGSYQNFGTLHVQTGTLNSGTAFSNKTGGLILGTGTINGDLQVDGGNIAPGNSIGNLTLTNSDFSVTAASTLEIELSGASADALIFQNPTSQVNIGTGLLALSVQLLGAPVIGNTYNILNISVGGSGITGTFAGLPNSGDSFVASYASIDYTFQVNYLTNSINLYAFSNVPEPGTYALLVGGLALLGLTRRRRRA